MPKLVLRPVVRRIGSDDPISHLPLARTTRIITHHYSIKIAHRVCAPLQHAAVSDSARHMGCAFANTSRPPPASDWRDIGRRGSCCDSVAAVAPSRRPPRRFDRSTLWPTAPRSVGTRGHTHVETSPAVACTRLGPVTGADQRLHTGRGREARPVIAKFR